MKLKTLWAVLLLMLLTGVSATVSDAQTDPGQNRTTTERQKDDDDNEREERVSAKERKQVKITVEQARQTALARVSGVVVEEELEKENGRIVYSIEIRDAVQKVFDVEVDAMTGEIVKVEEEIDDEENGDDDDNAQKRKQKQKQEKVKSVAKKKSGN